MLRINNLSASLDTREQDLRRIAARHLRVKPEMIQHLKVQKKSVDARDKTDVHFVYSLEVSLIPEKEEERAVQRKLAVRAAAPEPLWLPSRSFEHPLVVVGAGPAGLFCALMLAKAGAMPILIERGKPVDERARDVQALQEQSILDPQSNVQFGEGGAGAFSDGKLTTGTKSPLQQEILRIFVEHGAPEDILYLQRPHIGTDRLRGTVASIRQEIIRLGGQVRFSTRLTGLELRNRQVVGARVVGPAGEETIRTDTLFLCIGHSARDTITALFDQGVAMTAKPFAVGVRIEHLQAWVDRAQYGTYAGHPALRPAEYKLNVPTPDGRGVFTFCMCPGGSVIASASEPGGVVTNGMSLHARDGRQANAALLVGVRAEDFPQDQPLAGMRWQRRLEEAAFRAGGSDYRAPAQRVEDFLAGRPGTRFGEVQPTYRPGVVPCDLREILPAWIHENLAFALPRLDGQLRGFAHPDAVLTGVESRSSSPVRLPRSADGTAEGLAGLYPVGEGAGYAGGIMSAAVDGMQAALRVLQKN
ncbi:MAG: hypothetical protein IKH38_05235 [Clostridia bacterium]|nr:hypothetical protein [Clostridia bacterium]